MKAAPIQMTRFWAGVTAVAAIVTTAHAQKPKEAWEYLKEPGFKSAYIKALGPRANKAWLAKRDSPTPEGKFMQVAGERDAMNAFCNNRECGDNSAVMEEGVVLAAPVGGCNAARLRVGVGMFGADRDCRARYRLRVC